MAPESLDAAHFSPDIRAFLQLLAKHEVRYMIVGGEAVIYHGYVRLTGDVDFFYAADTANCTRLYAALSEFWDGCIPGLDAAEELAEEGLILQFGCPPNRMDLINRITGTAFSECWAQHVTGTMNAEGVELPVHYIGLEQLLVNKMASGRPKDLADAAYLREMLK